MGVNKNAILRYIAIDSCLSDRSKRWTLEDLIDACEQRLKDQGYADYKVGKRTVQLDIENMRSKENGYNAPIVVSNRKYYTYSDPLFRITQNAISGQDIDKLDEICGLLKHYCSFSRFKELDKFILKLEDIVNSEKLNQPALIEMDQNFTIKGNQFLDAVYSAIQNKKVLVVWYQSFKAKRPGKIVFAPYLLKEFRGRWYVIGAKHQGKTLLNLALDRIEEIEVLEDEPFFTIEGFDAPKYFSNVIGVTTNGQKPVNVYLLLNKEIAPYIISKPLHASQQIVKESDDGIEIVIQVIHNLELEREILGFGENVKVLAPVSLQQRLKERITRLGKMY
jgi:predicted DNA-binding transcriptional regulator YafY